MELRDTPTIVAVFMPHLGHKYFDFIKAAEIIKDRGVYDAEAGLAEDWGYTSGPILDSGVPHVNEWCYLHSRWATPVLAIGGEVIECWTEEECDTSEWPEKALNILKQET